MRHYCTYLDHHYLARGMVLHASLQAHSQVPFRLWILTLNEEAQRLLETLQLQGRLSEARILPLSTLEAAFPRLGEAKKNRTQVEYYFTLSPCFPLYLLQNHPEIPQLTYLDADTCFYGDPERIFTQIGEASLAITPHRFSPKLQSLRSCGTFNVGWITFRQDAEALSCLTRWQAQCLQWCHDRPEEGRYADQGYLDEWPERYPHLHILDAPGINAAAWNIDGAHWAASPQGVTLNGEPLLLFHFHGLKRIAPRVIDTMLRHFQVAHDSALYALVYRPYVHQWLQQSEILHHLHVAPVSGYLRNALFGDSFLRKACRWIGERLGALLPAKPAERLRCFLDWLSTYAEAACGQHFLVHEAHVLRNPWRT